MILHVTINRRLRKLTLERNPEDGSFVCEMDGEKMVGSARLLEPGILSLILGADSYRCILDRIDEEPAVHINGRCYGFRVEDPRSPKQRRSKAAGEAGPTPVKAPMPGRVVRIFVEQGADVAAHQGILIIEAMKMQNELKAPKAGKVTALRAAPGDTVNAGEVLAIVE